MMRVRHLRPAENWPDSIWMGFEGPKLDRDWCWVVEDEGGIQAGLLACPMHGCLFLLRLAAVSNASSIAVRTLLHGVLKDSKERGLDGWVTLIDPTASEGKKLKRLIASVGGVEWPRPSVLAFGIMNHAEEKL